MDTIEIAITLLLIFVVCVITLPVPDWDSDSECTPELPPLRIKDTRAWKKNVETDWRG